MNNLPKDEQEIRDFLRGLFDTAVAVANPENCISRHLPAPPKGRTLLIAAGKAAASMAHATEKAWPKNAPLAGVALTRYGHGMECKRVEVIEASHPVPDNRGHEAAKRLLDEVSTLGENDLLLFLVSGGGSSLLALPADGITLDEKKAVNQALLMSGAPIGEMNCVRKHLSAIKGGRLVAAAYPAKVVTLAISDVPGDDPSTIASGPTVPDPTTLEDARAIVEKYDLKLATSITATLNDVASETPKPGSAVFKNSEFELVSRPRSMLNAVVRHARSLGLKTSNHGADVEGEASFYGLEQAWAARRSLAADWHGLILSGGETTVTIDSGAKTGRGGRNCEYLLALAIGLNGTPGIYALAADTDGIDGSEDNAGAIVTPDTLTRAHTLGLNPTQMLQDHDAYTFFEALGDLVVTGPTLTNVNDFRAILVTDNA